MDDGSMKRWTSRRQWIQIKAAAFLQGVSILGIQDAVIVVQSFYSPLIMWLGNASNYSYEWVFLHASVFSSSSRRTMHRLQWAHAMVILYTCGNSRSSNAFHKRNAIQIRRTWVTSTRIMKWLCWEMAQIVLDASEQHFSLAFHSIEHPHTVRCFYNVS